MIVIRGKRTALSRPTHSRWIQKALPLLILAFAGAGLAGLGGLTISSRAVPMVQPAATQALTLYGSFSSGWGFSAASESTPGPTIVVNQFDVATLTLISSDGVNHRFLLDYNGDTSPSAGEPVSSFFSTSTSITFTASVAGTFTYYCTLHKGTMYGTWRTVALAPSAALSSPSGSQNWTGGSVHRIWWNMSDVQDPNSALTSFLNYSYNSGAGGGAIAGPLSGAANPDFYDWTAPALDATDVLVNLTVVDTTGYKAWSQAMVPKIDSTPPTVLSVFPVDASTDVSRTVGLLVNWSESMNLVATGSSASFGLQEVSSGLWVPGTFSWNSPQDTQMTFHPTSSLAAMSQYRAYVNDTALDASDPGNTVAVPMSWAFTTGAAGDTQPPIISNFRAVPDVQEIGGYVNVSATVTDNVAVASVQLVVTSSAGTSTVAMRRGTGDLYYLNATYGDTGAHSFQVSARDTSDLVATASGQFTIQDTQPPAISHTPGGSLPLGEGRNLTASVTDAGGVASVRLNWTDPSGQTRNVSMSASGSLYWYLLPNQLQPGTVSYFLWARDAAGNAARTPSYSFTVTVPPGAILLYGDATRGWGFGLDNLTSPGPTLRVAAGTTVTLVVIAADGAGESGPMHDWFLDYDGNGSPTAGEPRSAEVMGNATILTFVADRAGTFVYYCEFHPAAMHGTFVVESSVPPSPQGLSPALLVGVALVAIAAIAVVALLLRRRSPPSHGGP